MPPLLAETTRQPAAQNEPVAAATGLRARLVAAIGGWRSLKTRLTLLTLAILIIGIWSLAWYASRTLRTDMERVLGEQAFSVASLLAADINQEFGERISVLERVVSRVSPALMSKAPALQTFLEGLPALSERFNGGVLAVGPDGVAVADTLAATGRIGVNYLDIDTVAAALKHGQSTIGRPVMGKKLQAPVIGITVPVRDPDGKVIGAVVGLTNLGLPNFLDTLAQHGFGKAGNFLLVAPQHRLIVTASEKRLIMTETLAPGTDALSDRFMQGYEGFGILTDSSGTQVLSAAKAVPVAGWLVAASLPTSEAFAPIRRLQQRLLMAAAFLSLLAAGLIWWIVRHQFAPLLSAVKTLSRAAQTLDLQPLSIVRPDEIGDLMGAFNRVLKALREQQCALSGSEGRFRLAIEQAPFPVMIHADDGAVVAISRAWADITGYTLHDIATIADWTDKAYGEKQEAVRAHIDTIYDLTYRQSEGEYQIRCRDGSARLWDFMSVGLGATPDGRRIAISMAMDITERRQAELALERLTRLYATHSQTNQAIVRCDHEEALFNEVCSIAVTFGAMKMAWIGLVDERGLLLQPVASFGDDSGYVADARIVLDGDDPRGQGPIGTAIRTAQPVWIQDFLHHPRTAPWHEGAARSGWAAVAALPLRRRGVVAGALALYASQINAFDEPIQKLLLEMAADISFAMDRYADAAERQRIEARLAEQMQELQRWQQATLGREGRVMALKRELNELLAERGQAPRYPSVVETGSDQGPV